MEIQESISNEIKARIFGLYLGAEMQVEGNREAYIYKVFRVDIAGFATTEGLLSIKIDKCQLILTPLENITDADAIACYDLTADEQDIKNIIPSKKIDIIKVEINGGILIDYRLVDYLRSKGYHIPYMGIDLFLIGIAIERTPTTPQP